MLTFFSRHLIYVYDNELSTFKRFGTCGYRLVVEYVFRLYEALGTVYSYTQDWVCSPMIACLASIHKALSSPHHINQTWWTHLQF